MRVLVVDDDKAVRDLLEVLFLPRGHEVTLCADAGSAWTAYQEDDFPMVVLDWMLPDMEGIELCRMIRKLPKGAGSFILMYTAKDKLEDMRTVLTAGADDYLTKDMGTKYLSMRLEIAERQAESLIQKRAAEIEIDSGTMRRDAIAELGINISKAQSIDEVLQAIGNTVGRITQVDIFKIYLRDHDGMFRLRTEIYGDGVDKSAAQKETPFAAGETLNGKVVSTKKSILLEDVSAEISSVEHSWMKEMNIGSYAGFPILKSTEVIGVLVLCRLEIRPFGGMDQKVLDILGSYASIAIEKSSLLEDEKDRVARLEIGDKIAMAVGSSLKPDEIFQIVGHEIRNAIPCDRLIVSKIDFENKSFITYYEYADAPLHPFLSEDLSQDFMEEEVYEKRELLRIGNLENSLWEDHYLTKAGYSDAAFFPIVIDDRCVAHLGILRRQSNDFHSSEIELLSSIAGHLGSAIRNANLYRESEKRNERLSVLNELNQKIVENLNLSEVLESITSSAVELFGADISRIYLKNENDETLGLKICHSLLPQPGESRLELQNPSMRSWMKKTGKPLIIRDVQREEMWEEQAWAKKEDVKSFMGHPLRIENEVIGFIDCLSQVEGYFAVEDLQLLSSLATQAAIAIQNAHLHEDEIRSREFFNSVVRDSADPITVINNQRNIIYWNEAAEALYGYSADEVLGSQIDVFIPEPEYEKWKKIDAEIIDEKKKGSYVTTRCRKDGTFVQVNLTLSPVLDDEGNVVAIAGMHKDLSEQKKTEEALAGLNRELDEKNKDLETVFSVASHDLRSPLVNIQGYSKELDYIIKDITVIIEEEKDIKTLKEKLQAFLQEEIPETLGFLLAGAARMDALLSGLLRYSRLGYAAVNLETIDMNQIVQSIAAAMEYQVKEAEADFEMMDLPVCCSDPVLVNQVFSNLMDNALKYLDDSRKGKICVSGRIEGETAVYCVRDNGIGISKDHQEKIFEIFHRLGSNSSPGEGLGLTLALRILDKLNGKIWLESELGKGSKFYVSLSRTNI